MKFDLGRVIFHVIAGNAETENASFIFPFPSLIFEILKLQKNVLHEGEALEAPRKPIRISSKLYTGLHYEDAENDDQQKDMPTLSLFLMMLQQISLHLA